MFRIFITLSLILGISSFASSQVKLLKSDFLKTKIGTIEKQKLITKIEKKVIKKIPKKKLTKKIVKKKAKKINLTVAQKKQRFKEVLVPIVTLVYQKLYNHYEEVRSDIINNKNSEYINVLKKEYKSKTNEELLSKLKPHPVSIVLAQAAIESAWLTSRFAVSANNIFGVWSFNKNEPRIAASGLRGKKTIYLKKYKTYKQAVENYYLNISIGWAYEDFRYTRLKTDNPYDLLEHLKTYSEKGEEYTKLLASVIKYNKFDDFDIKPQEVQN